MRFGLEALVALSYLELGELGARTDESPAALRMLWDEPMPHFEGRFVSFSNVIQRPRPTHRPA